MRGVFKQFINFLSSVVSSLSNFTIFLVVTCVISWFSYSFNSDLPKPETFIELIKFYMKDPGNYLTGVLLNVFSGFLWFVLGSALIFFGVSEREYYSTWVIVLLLCLSLIPFFLSFYFVGYFLLLLISLAILAGIAYLVIWLFNQK